jgi:cobalamin biosynthesis Co2+ chelatase CbiK
MKWEDLLRSTDILGKIYWERRKLIVEELEKRLRQVIPDIEIHNGYYDSDCITFISQEEEAREDEEMDQAIKELKERGSGFIRYWDIKDKKIEAGELKPFEDIVAEVLKENGIGLKEICFEAYFCVKADKVLQIKEILKNWLKDKVGK